MKRGAWMVLFASLGFAAVIAVCHHAAERGCALLSGALAAEDSGSKDPPPLVVNKDAPLLLAEPEEPAEPDFFDVPPGPLADNSACFVCHANYEEESFAVVHAKANVACMKCHGQSYEHRDDEDNVTPPDVMFPPEKIQSNCDECHDDHDVPAVKVIARWQERCPGKTDPENVLCTDCHGEHRLKIRTVWWNKSTGELIVRRQGETTKVRPDQTGQDPEKAPEEEIK